MQYGRIQTVLEDIDLLLALIISSMVQFLVGGEIIMSAASSRAWYQ